MEYTVDEKDQRRIVWKCLKNYACSKEKNMKERAKLREISDEAREKAKEEKWIRVEIS